MTSDQHQQHQHGDDQGDAPCDVAGKVWVCTDAGPGTTYRVVLGIDEDDAPVDLGNGLALVHARAVMAAVAHAEQDAAVSTQLTALGMPDGEMAAVVTALREQRRPIAWPTALHLVPIVSHRDRRPVLFVQVRGETVGAWEVDDAREHAVYVLEAIEVAEADRAYLEVLLDAEIPEESARAAVAALRGHRSDAQGDDGPDAAPVEHDVVLDGEQGSQGQA